jgi:hypothetical protein
VAPRIAAASCLLLLALAGCGSDGGGDEGGTKATGAAPSWPAPPNPMALAKKAGLVPEKAEFLQYHVHAHLDVFFNGEPVTVPAGIGIDTDNPAVVSDSQGVGLTGECDKPCISPLHTHATDGVLHTETLTPKPNNLGQFFVEWNVQLDSSCIGDYCDPKTSWVIYVDGKKYDGDPREIELSNLREIAIVIGSAPAPIPSEFPQ